MTRGHVERGSGAGALLSGCWSAIGLGALPVLGPAAGEGGRAPACAHAAVLLRGESTWRARQTVGTRSASRARAPRGSRAPRRRVRGVCRSLRRGRALLRGRAAAGRAADCARGGAAAARAHRGGGRGALPPRRPPRGPGMGLRFTRLGPGQPRAHPALRAGSPRPPARGPDLHGAPGGQRRAAALSTCAGESLAGKDSLDTSSTMSSLALPPDFTLAFVWVFELAAAPSSCGPSWRPALLPPAPGAEALARALQLAQLRAQQVLRALGEVALLVLAVPEELLELRSPASSASWMYCSQASGALERVVQARSRGCRCVPGPRSSLRSPCHCSASRGKDGCAPAS